MIKIRNLTAQSKSGSNFKQLDFTSQVYFNELVSKVKTEIATNGKVNFKEQSIFREEPVFSQKLVYFLSLFFKKLKK